MDEHDLRALVAEVKAGRVSRRRFIQMMVGVGLTAPMAGQMLSWSGVANAQAKASYKPTKRGGGGALKCLRWQGPTLLNPHFAVGTKDQYGSRIFYEPLAAWDGDGNLVPILAAEVPSVAERRRRERRQVGHLEAEESVQWHDGKPFTADDVVFNWEYAADPATATMTIGSYKDMQGARRSTATRSASQFEKPTPFWADAFVGTSGMIIPKHLFEHLQGREVARGADQPQARGHRPLHLRRFHARRPGARAS